MANLTTTTYTHLISALTADVTNSHSASLSTPDESAIVSKEYYATRDYWLTVPMADINNALINLIPYDTADTAGGTEDVQGYAFNQTIVGGKKGAHFMRYVLSKCTVANDPIKTGKLIEPLDSALESIEETFGDAEIIIQDNMQEIYDEDSGSLTKLIAGLDATTVMVADETVGMSDTFTYGDTNDESQGEWGLSKQTVYCSVAAGGTAQELFHQINRLCANEASSLDSSTGRDRAVDASNQFVVGDVLFLGDGSKFQTQLSMSNNTTDHPSDSQIANEVKIKGTAADAAQDWSTFSLNQVNEILSNGCVFLQVV